MVENLFVLLEQFFWSWFAGRFLIIYLRVFFSFWRLPPHNLLSFFSNGDIPKLKQLLQITEGWLKVDGPEKSNLEEAKIGHILDRMMIA